MGVKEWKHDCTMPYMAKHRVLAVLSLNTLQSLTLTMSHLYHTLVREWLPKRCNNEFVASSRTPRDSTAYFNVCVSFMRGPTGPFPKNQEKT